MVAIANLYPYPNVENTSNGNRWTSSFMAPVRGMLKCASEDFGQIRIDQNFSSKDTAFVRYTVDSARVLKPDNYPQFKDHDSSQSQFLTLAENHIFSSALLNTVRVSYARTNLSTLSLPSSPAAASQIEAPGATSLIDNPDDPSGDCPGGKLHDRPACAVRASQPWVPPQCAPGYLDSESAYFRR